MIGLMPAEVDSIDRERRLVKIRIPGLTDGAKELPEAQLCQPIGDKSEHTEIRIKPGDRVWLAFEGGDTRYPVIVGYRPRNQENGIDWRRFEHGNFQFDADANFIINAGVKVTVNAPAVIVNASEKATVISPVVLVDSADTTFTGPVKVKGLLTYSAGLAGSGGTEIDGTIKNNGTDIGSEHTHGSVKTGEDNSGKPN